VCVALNFDDLECSLKPEGQLRYFRPYFIKMALPSLGTKIFTNLTVCKFHQQRFPYISAKFKVHPQTDGDPRGNVGKICDFQPVARCM